MLFRGHTYRTLDPKGRLLLPPEFRDILSLRSEGGRCMLTTLDGCLVAWPWPEWEAFEASFDRIASPSRLLRDFRRVVLGGAEELELDAQNRVRLSKSHMEFAGITKDVVLVGQASRFEIWDAEKFRALCNQNYDDVADELAKSGFDFSF